MGFIGLWCEPAKTTTYTINDWWFQFVMVSKNSLLTHQILAENANKPRSWFLLPKRKKKNVNWKIVEPQTCSENVIPIQVHSVYSDRWISHFKMRFRIENVFEMGVYSKRLTVHKWSVQWKTPSPPDRSMCSNISKNKYTCTILV